MAEAMTTDAIEDALTGLAGWSYEPAAGDAGGKITRSYKLDDFKSAMGFMVRIGFEAEALGHHPEMFNVYSSVDIALSTHDAGGKVTAKDIELAKRIEAIAPG